MIHVHFKKLSPNRKFQAVVKIEMCLLEIKIMRYLKY